jgi:hypothetical protein
MIFKKYSFPKLTQFSQGKNVLDAPASTSDGGLWTDTCVSSTQLNKPIWNNHRLSPVLQTHLAESILFKKELNCHREKNVLDSEASNIDCFLWSETCVTST